MSTEFDTNQFEWTYGYKPHGRGSWAFAVPGHKDPVWVPGSVTYGDAKKWIKQMFPGSPYVKVLT